MPNSMQTVLCKNHDHKFKNYELWKLIFHENMIHFGIFSFLKDRSCFLRERASSLDLRPTFNYI